MSADGERNYLTIVALVIALISIIAATAGFLVWRRHSSASEERSRPESRSTPPTEVAAPPTATAPPTPTETAASTPTETATAMPTPTATAIATATATATATAASDGIPDAARAISRARARFRTCYNRGLADDPNLDGSLVITLVVAPSGEVTSATKKSGGLNPKVDACLLEQAKSIVFDPTSSGGTMNIPLQFHSAR